MTQKNPLKYLLVKLHHLKIEGKAVYIKQMKSSS
jgi:hypothetical protein